jgi:hypothetical protein
MKKFLFILLSFVAGNCFAQDIAGAANQFISTLTPALKSEAQFPIDDEERFNMNFVPTIRRGPTFRDFNAAQKTAALNLLRVSLSSSGYTKATEIMELEKILRVMEGEATLSDGSPRRDPLNYHFCIFGTPSSMSPWMWRFEGHHLSFNFACQNGKVVSSTPSFMGSNPAIVRNGDEKGKQVLKQEMALGFELVNLLTAKQLEKAKISDSAPAEIITGTSRKVAELTPKGISYALLDDQQRKTFDRLLKVYVDNYELGFSKTLMEKIKKSGIENLSFAWAGPLKPGEGEYYRIQGPMLLIEYDNTQNNGNHVHTVVRDLTNDFAEDILREHYKDHHK